jgi:antitoxin YefM
METSYTYARDHLADLWDKVIADCEPVILKRRAHPDLALISATELSSLLETLRLLRTPENARRYFDAIERLDRGEGVEMTIEQLKTEAGVG